MYPENRAHPVGNPLLSERDGNYASPRIVRCLSGYGRKPTTLWKRWKLFHRHTFRINGIQVGNPLLSERDGNFLDVASFFWNQPLVGNPLLSERDGNSLISTNVSNSRQCVGNPLLSERDGNYCTNNSGAVLTGESETHYSLKEMETPMSSTW